MQSKCQQIEIAVVEALDNIAAGTRALAAEGNERHDNIRRLIQDRKALPGNATADRAAISKELRKEIKLKKRERAESKIEEILSKFSGLNAISGMRTCKKRDLIADIEDKNGTRSIDRQGIADIFADFYAELYTSHLPDDQRLEGQVVAQDIAPFSMSELDIILREMKNEKGKDGKGIVAEMYKNSGANMRT